MNEHFVQQIKADDIVSTYSGVRPLCDDESNDPSTITRDYTLELEDTDGTLPLLSIFGGKITTYRKLAEAALSKLHHYFPEMGESWTAKTSLPGATEATHTLSDVRSLLQEVHPWLSVPMLERFSRSYGILCLRFLGNAKSTQDLGEHFGHGLYQAEVDYLIGEEWATTCEDILWRRTKLGLLFSNSETGNLASYLKPEAGIKQPA